MTSYINPTLPTRVLSEVEYNSIVRQFAWDKARRYAIRDTRNYAKVVWKRLTGSGSLLDDHNEALR